MSDSKQLPAWPDSADFVNADDVGATFDSAGFRDAQLAFYASRLRVAVEALQTELRETSPVSASGRNIAKALALIGPLPPKETT